MLKPLAFGRSISFFFNLEKKVGQTVRSHLCIFTSVDLVLFFAPKTMDDDDDEISPSQAIPSS